MRALLVLPALLLTACLATRAAPPPVAQAESLCEPVSFEDTAHLVCTIDLRRDRLGLFWRDAEGRIYGSLDALEADLAARGEPVLVAMNAGMYEPDMSPVGLFVAGGAMTKPVNTADGDGNFYLKPNGVFYLTKDGSAGILETGAYLAAAPDAEIATQSGPMLVIDGEIHPVFEADGASRKIRNGIGVRDPHTVVFAIAREGVSFGRFARLFRDALGCDDALYLDGSVSALSEPGAASAGGGGRLGPIIAAFAGK